MEKIENYFSELDEKLISNYQEFYTLVINSRRFSKEEIILIEKAYETAKTLHEGTYRKSGEPYIIHPLNVANLLTKYGFDADTICAALLHDTVEDTKYTIEEMKNDFSNDIAMLVEGVTKMKKADFSSREEIQMATHKKILQSITKDARIIAIKLVDRLHNLMTLEAMDETKQKEKALETMKFYVPIARNLGIYQIKDEIQDLCLFFLDNEGFLKYYDYRNWLKEQHRGEYLYVGEKTGELLEKQGINLDYNYKVKNVAGIYEEVKNGKKTNQIHDLIAIRMLLDKTMECYQALGAVHSFCRPVPGGVVDYIANPKFNGYRSLNTNVIISDSSCFQVRIRTRKMQQIDSLGAIGNWSEETQGIINDMCIGLIELNGCNLSDKEYVDASIEEFLRKTITIKTKDGDIELKELSTGYDYIKHIGYNADGIEAIIINDEQKSLDSVLIDGDFVSVVRKNKIISMKRKEN